MLSILSLKNSIVQLLIVQKWGEVIVYSDYFSAVKILYDVLILLFYLILEDNYKESCYVHLVPSVIQVSICSRVGKNIVYVL